MGMVMDSIWIKYEPAVGAALAANRRLNAKILRGQARSDSIHMRLLSVERGDGKHAARVGGVCAAGEETQGVADLGQRVVRVRLKPGDD